MTSFSNYAKPQLITDVNYYEITSSAISEGVLTFPHNANYIRFVGFSSAVTNTNIVSNANELQYLFIFQYFIWFKR